MNLSGLPHPGRYGKGYIPDTHDKTQDKTLRHLLGARTKVSAEAMRLLQFLALIGVKDQKATSSCTGFAFAYAVFLRCAAMGVPIAYPSPTGIYVVGRAIDQPEGEPLQDNGANPDAIRRGLSEWGIPSDAVWPLGGFDAAYAKDATAAFIDELPDLGELEAAAGFLLQGWYRIDTVGAEREADVQQALDNDFPVCVGTAVGNAFEAYAGGTNADGTLKTVSACNPTDVLGGHMMCLGGYKPDPAKPDLVRYRGLNQWGPEWGDGGLYWADSSFIQDPLMSDLIVITVGPTHAGATR